MNSVIQKSLERVPPGCVTLKLRRSRFFAGEKDSLLHAQNGCFPGAREETLDLRDLDVSELCPSCDDREFVGGVSLRALLEWLSSLELSRELLAKASDTSTSWHSRVASLTAFRTSKPYLPSRQAETFMSSMEAELTKESRAVTKSLVDFVALSPEECFSGRLTPCRAVKRALGTLSQAPFTSLESFEKELEAYLISGPKVLMRLTEWDLFRDSFDIELWFSSWKTFGSSGQIRLVPPFAPFLYKDANISDGRLASQGFEKNIAPTEPADTDAVFETAARFFEDGGCYETLADALTAARLV